jgi:hypothetical protein
MPPAGESIRGRPFERAVGIRSREGRAVAVEAGGGPVRSSPTTRPVQSRPMLVGRVLLAVLGAIYWSYALWPRLPVIRSLPYFWRGNLRPSPEWRFFSAVFGTACVVGAILIGPPSFR